MEEGEIRSVDPDPPKNRPEMSMGEGMRAVEKSVSMHGNTNGLHGEANGSGPVSLSPRKAANLNESGSRLFGNENTGEKFHMGCNKDLGQRQEPNTRKRRRCNRSPMSLDKGENDVWAQKYKLPDGLDLNDPVRTDPVDGNNTLNRDQSTGIEITGEGEGAQEVQTI
ncbi:hypothetical protein Hanom_Chr01g00006591 [Helianthus anomalus]